MGDNEEVSVLKTEESPLGLLSSSPSSPSSSCVPDDVLSNTVAVETLEGEFQNLALEENTNTDNNNEDNENVGGDSDVKEEKINTFQYPQRSDEPDCSYYLRTGTCRYGSNCRFNHPIRWKNQASGSSDPPESVQEREKENEGSPEKTGQTECKYYLRTGGCKFGKACRYSHPREKSVVGSPLELNFLGLPIRPGEKECPYYMRTGSCKYATNCRFHHPDPTAVGGSDPLSGYNRSGSVSLHSSGASQPALTSWSSPRTSNDSVPYMEASTPYVPVVLPPPRGVHANSEWNGYQAPVYPPERCIHPPSAMILNNPTKMVNPTTQQQTHGEEFPERPGQPECSYFMKTGDCKYRSACKYHHPKNRAPKSSVCTLSPMGLPLRPDQSICTHYNRYGICKFGPACKFDHPINCAPSTSSIVSTPSQPPSFGVSSSLDGCGNGGDALIQQSV
ncbi:PREDICTED: zinc finger CCCH domain-containing protein 67 isoform X2 [Nelumbo nucifera]|uniref:Zinc finger CCCH domain-containing protein 67 isoform X2 n=2 Tax=Nelumbo nucifera TaxID=4432 RepID=A0A1U7ZLK3_NELNU|nr:PREDICTED: zinc finger CCCH domain-containing protein 67 isoform X2 [Nelumbo nucifera]DAD30694.1 TPA_asm: hypothetical protein HUJ06_009545 [Nelumbo nucifera]